MSYYVYKKTSDVFVPAATWTDCLMDVLDQDPDSAMSAGVLTVPAGWNGKYAQIMWGVRCTQSENSFSLRILKSTDGGSNWTIVCQDGHDNNVLMSNISSPVMLMATGDKYKCQIWTGSTTYIDASPNATFASGALLPTSPNIDRFEFKKSADQAVSSSQYIQIVHDTIQYESYAPSMINTGTGLITIPVGYPDSIFMGHFQLKSNDGIEYWTSYFNFVSTNGFTNLSSQQAHSGQNRFHSRLIVPVKAGDQLHTNIFVNNSGTIDGGTDYGRTFVHGMLYPRE